MKTRFIAFLLLFVMNLGVFAQSSYQPTEENLKARQEFQDNKFGIFLHWGLYAMLATGEWTMTNNNLNYKEYAKLAGGFYPSKFDADKWVAAIKASGAKYICFTTRHHEGFSMFDTKYSDYNVVKATLFKRDIVKELAAACAKQGIKLHFYYSRRIGAIWFDGWWDQPKTFNWELPEQYALIHKLQPGCLVGNNHHQTPFDGEDIQIFERDLPGENASGLSGQEVSRLPLETCETMNGMWGYKITDQNYKSTKTLIHYLVKAAGKNANLLMNIGPQPDGELPAVAVQRLAEMGEWMKQYGETIYGTRSGAVAPHDWGVTTQKGNKLYVHILDLKDAALFLPLTDKKVKKAVLFKDQSPVRFAKTKAGVLLEFAEVPKDIDYVVELTID